MTIENIKLGINDCYQAFLELELPDEHKTVDNNSLQPALAAIRDMSMLLASCKPEMAILCEAGRKIKEMDRLCLQESDLPPALTSKALVCHSKAINLLALIDQALLDNFLALSPEKQDDLLLDAHSDIRASLLRAVQNPEVINTIRDPAKGNYLFHQLCRSTSIFCRELAEECLNAGFDINKQNLLGGTGLHFAVINRNEGLTDILLKRDADPTISIVQNNLTTFDLALKYNSYSCFLLLALKQPQFEVDKIPAAIHLIRLLAMDTNENVSIILELLDKFAEKNDMNPFSNIFWKACSSVVQKDKNYDLNLCSKLKENLEQVMKWGLINGLSQSPPSEEHMMCAEWLLERICSPQILDEYRDFHALELLAKQGLLPYFPSFVFESGASALRKIMQLPTLPSNLRATLSTVTDEEDLAVFEDLNFGMKKFQRTCFAGEIVLTAKFYDSLRLLKAKHFPTIEKLEDAIKRLTKQCRKQTAQCLEMKNMLENGYYSPKNISQRLYDSLNAYLITEKKLEISF